MQDATTELVAVNPTAIFGPTLTTDLRSSTHLIKMMLDGTMPVVPRARFAVVDVRDVADLHVRAMANPDAAGNRFLAVSNDPATSFLELAQLLRDHLGVPTPTEEAPGPDPPRPTIHNTRARTLLGWTPRPLQTTILETAQSLHDLGLL